MRQLYFRLATMLLTLLAWGRCAGQVQPTSPAAGTTLAGQVRDAATQQPLGFVSVGVLRLPFGTVADERGMFALSLPASYDADSVRFSLLGYASRTVVVAKLRQLVRGGAVLLRPQAVPLREARVQSAGLRRRVLGNQGGGMFEGFHYNLAGNQMGQRIKVERGAFLQEVSFKMTHCSYDTVDLRLNVYRLKDDFPDVSVLPKPLYLRLSGEQVGERTFVNLRPYQLWLTDDVIVSLELVRSLGQGTLVFLAAWPGGGPAYHLEQTPGPLDERSIKPKGMTEIQVRERRQPDNGPWTMYPGVGMGIDATLLQLPE